MSFQSDHNKNQFYRSLSCYDRKQGYCTSTVRVNAENERHQIASNPAGDVPRVRGPPKVGAAAVMGLCKKIGAPTTTVL